MILEKPEDKEDAHKMLKLLSGRQHSVITAVSLLYINRNIDYTFTEKTLVTFNHLNETISTLQIVYLKYP